MSTSLKRFFDPPRIPHLSIGQWFKITNPRDDLGCLAQVGADKVVVINITAGNRQRDPVIVRDALAITPVEAAKCGIGPDWELLTLKEAADMLREIADAND